MQEAGGEDVIGGGSDKPTSSLRWFYSIKPVLYVGFKGSRSLVPGEGGGLSVSTGEVAPLGEEILRNT